MISIGLCMIVKNEEAVLRRILTPMSKLVDKIYICDTGSVDKTKEIAREFTDEVYDFLWKDDFSAARNFITEKADTDYWMWLDADDVITPENQEKLLRLKESMDSDTDVVMMDYAVGFDECAGHRQEAAAGCHPDHKLLFLMGCHLLQDVRIP